MGKRIYYLDHASATPCDLRALEKMQPYLSDVFYNPSASYSGGKQARDALESARSDIAIVIGAKSNDIVFTAGATESINIAIHGVLARGGGAVIGATEHVAVRNAVKEYSHKIARVDKYGLIDIEHLASCIDDRTTLVSVALADSEFGTVQPLAEIARSLEIIRQKRRHRGVQVPLYFHTDASQGQSTLDISVSRLGVDMMTLNSSKSYGPKQVGALWFKSLVELKPLFEGGGQERGIRGGTENIAGAVGFAKALSLAQESRHQEARRLSVMKKQLVRGILSGIPGVVIDGHPRRGLPGHIHFHIDGLDAERVVFHLDNEGIYIATGAACSANRLTRSPILEAMGLTDSESNGSLRITLGRLNEAEDVEYIIERIVNAVQTERKL